MQRAEPSRAEPSRAEPSRAEIVSRGREPAGRFFLSHNFPRMRTSLFLSRRTRRCCASERPQSRNMPTHLCAIVMVVFVGFGAHRLWQRQDGRLHKVSCGIVHQYRCAVQWTYDHLLSIPIPDPQLLQQQQQQQKPISLFNESLPRRRQQFPHVAIGCGMPICSGHPCHVHVQFQAADYFRPRCDHPATWHSAKALRTGRGGAMSTLQPTTFQIIDCEMEWLLEGDGVPNRNYLDASPTEY